MWNTAGGSGRCRSSSLSRSISRSVIYNETRYIRRFHQRQWPGGGPGAAAWGGLCRVGRLVEGADRAGGIFDDAIAAAGVAARRGDEGSAEALALGDAVIEILDGDVDQPHWRQVGVAAAGVADAGDVHAVGIAHHEVGVAAHAEGLGPPAGDGLVEIAGLL